MSTAETPTTIDFTDIDGSPIQATRIVALKRDRGYNGPDGDTFQVTYVNADGRQVSRQVSYYTYCLLRDFTKLPGSA